MYYHTIKEINEMLEKIRIKIIEIYQENKWVVIVCETGIKIKIKNY